MQINILQASLERLDLKIAKSRWPGWRCDVQDDCQRMHMKPPSINQMTRLVSAHPVPRSRKHTAYIGNMHPPGQKKSSKYAAHRGSHAGKAIRKTTNWAPGVSAGKRQQKNQPPPLHKSPAASMTHKHPTAHQNRSHPHDHREFEQDNSAMCVNDAHDIWTQVLLAGVMATFGRCGLSTATTHYVNESVQYDAITHA